MSYDEMSRTIIPELKVLYPSVTAVSISHTLETTVDSLKTDTVALAVLKFGRHRAKVRRRKSPNGCKPV